jgi:phospholipase C
LIEALVDHPEVFSKTVFIVNYDEAGGFYDHMPPPMPPLAEAEGYSTVSTDGEAKDYRGDPAVPNRGRYPLGLGIRVPAIVVSPWSRGGFVCSEVFDHTSTLRFLEKRFGVAEPNISAWRRTVCGDLTSAFDFKSPNLDWTVLTLPDTADYMQRVARSLASPSLKIPAVQVPSAQDGGQAMARPLRYRLSADARIERGRLWIDLVNAGGTGAVFQVFDAADAAGPWRFTVGPGERYAAGHWNRAAPLDAYDLILHGPNGFYRRFAGRTGQDLAVALTEATGGVVVAITNSGAVSRTVRAAMDEPYPIDAGALRQRKVVVDPGQTAQILWALAASDEWYSLTVLAEGIPDFRQRFAGHVETGRASRTDPGIGGMRL